LVFALVGAGVMVIVAVLTAEYLVAALVALIMLVGTLWQLRHGRKVGRPAEIQDRDVVED
jgi:hypothetical protein